jgi:hypothetical protein
MCGSGVVAGTHLCRGAHGCAGAALSQGRTYAATKSPGAILDNTGGVGPKGGGQEARSNDMDVRERRCASLRDTGAVAT